MSDYDYRSADVIEHAANVQADDETRLCHGHDVFPDHACTDLCSHSNCCFPCVHCFDDGTPVYPHDEHETLPAYVARQEADLIREALALTKERDR